MSEGSTTEPVRVLLTGRPGCGKTTVVIRTVEQVGRDRCSGFYTEEVRSQGRRIGFDVVSLEGHRAPLARVGEEGPRVGRYGVQLDEFEQVGVSALERGLDRRDHLLVVDEVGKMELFSDRFRSVLSRLLEESKSPVLGTLMRGRDRLVDRLRTSPNTRTIEVTVENRDDLPPRLGRLFRSRLEGGA